MWHTKEATILTFSGHRIPASLGQIPGEIVAYLKILLWSKSDFPKMHNLFLTKQKLLKKGWRATTPATRLHRMSYFKKYYMFMGRWAMTPAGPHGTTSIYNILYIYVFRFNEFF